MMSKCTECQEIVTLGTTLRWMSGEKRFGVQSRREASTGTKRKQKKAKERAQEPRRTTARRRQEKQVKDILDIPPSMSNTT